MKKTSKSPSTITLRKRTLRRLSVDQMEGVVGGTLLGFDQGGTSTCDTYTCNGCYGSGNYSGGGTDYNY